MQYGTRTITKRVGCFPSASHRQCEADDVTSLHHTLCFHAPTSFASTVIAHSLLHHTTYIAAPAYNHTPTPTLTLSQLRVCSWLLLPGCAYSLLAASGPSCTPNLLLDEFDTRAANRGGGQRQQEGGQQTGAGTEANSRTAPSYRLQPSSAPFLPLAHPLVTTTPHWPPAFLLPDPASFSPPLRR